MVTKTRAFQIVCILMIIVVLSSWGFEAKIFATPQESEIFSQVDYYNNLQKDETIIRLTEGWEYSSGDSKFDENNIPLWTYKNETLWNLIERPFMSIAENNGLNNVWYRTKMPQGNWENPCLYFAYANSAFDVYLNNELIYKSGKIDTNGKGRFNAWAFHFIPLGEANAGDYLYFRFYSNDLVGNIGISSHVEIGPQINIIIRTLRNDILILFIGFGYFLMGIIMMVLFVKNPKEKLHLFIALFSIGVGSINITDNGIYNLILGSDHSLIELYLAYLGLIFMAGGSSGILSCILKLKSLKVCMNIITTIIFSFFIFSSVLHVLNLFKFYDAIVIFNDYILTIGAVFGIGSFIIQFKKERYFQILAIGIGNIIFLLAGLHDSLKLAGIINTNYLMTKYGSFFFILSILLIVINNYMKMNKDLKLNTLKIQSMLENLKLLVSKSRSVSSVTDSSVKKLAVLIEKNADSNKEIESAISKVSSLVLFKEIKLMRVYKQLIC